MTTLGILATHPIHYQTYLFRTLASCPDVSVTVIFCSRFGLQESVDHTSGVACRWYDGSVLDGFPHFFLRNLSWESSPRSVFGTMNPGIIAFLRRSRFDALLVQGYVGLTEWLALTAARALGLAVLFRGETVSRTGGPLLRSAARASAMRSLGHLVHVFLPIGTSSRNFYLNSGISSERLVDAPYVVDNATYMTKADALRPAKPAVCHELDIPQGPPIVLFLGKLIDRKRPMDVLRACGRCGRQVVVLFVGGGPLQPVLEEEAKRYPELIVRCVGFKRADEGFPYYAAADVFVLPSSFESWGVVLNEAMCFGLPVVATTGVAAAHDLIQSGENGFVYDIGDVDALAGILSRLLADGDLRWRMGQRSRDLIDGWSIRETVAGINRGLRLALAMRSRPPRTGTKTWTRT